VNDERPASERALVADEAIVLSRRRVVAALGVGLVAGAAVAVSGRPLLAPIAVWVVAAGIVLLGSWQRMWPMDAAATEGLAELESRSRTTDDAILASALVSLGVLVLVLVRYSGGSSPTAIAAVVLSFVSAALSWCLVNTVFALKYARAYYLDEDGGIDFNQPEPPAYSDFAYLAFTLGMSFAVSDNDVTSSQIRRLALGHALLSYLFGTVVLAVTINLVTNLGG
jgi:uncharacterized membrane protein